MNTFRQKIESSRDFLIGVELVTTRGTMKEVKARQTRALASELTHCDAIDWVSITDNAGGNPMLSPVALGKNILYSGKDVLIHLSCKDFNRHGLESEAWSLASEGFQNILALSGDYPAEGYRGRAKSVFDIDSVGLLTLLDEMNSGLGRPTRAAGDDNGTCEPTEFFLGGVSAQALELSGRQADLHLSWIEPLENTAKRLDEARARLERASEAERILIACLRNRLAAALTALETSNDLAIVCSGDGGGSRPSVEDVYTAGALVERLVALEPTLERAAGARLALRIHDSYATAADAFADAPHADNLRQLGLHADLEFAAELDVDSARPVVARDSQDRLRIIGS